MIKNVPIKVGTQPWGAVMIDAPIVNVGLEINFRTSDRAWHIGTVTDYRGTESKPTYVFVRL